MMPWRSPSRLRSEPGAAARQAPFAGGRLLTVMMLRGYYRPSPAVGHPSRILLVGLYWRTGLRRPTRSSRWLNPARSGRSSSAPDSGHPGGRICYTPVPGIDQTTHHASCCFTCVVILHFAILRLLNRRLQNMLSGIPMLCGRTVALKQR